MRKTVILLSVLALLVCSCKPKVTPETPPRADTLHIPQAELQQETAKYDHIDGFYYQGLKVVNKKFKQGYINARGTIVVNEKIKWGYIDTTGTEVIPLQYDYAWNFSSEKEYTQVRLNDEIFFIDKTGKKLNTDSILSLEKQVLIDEFSTNPLVSADEIAAIAPVIKKWTDFYKLDFAQARLMNVRTGCFNCPQDDTNGVYYYEFTGEEKEFDTDKKIDAEYSPDKQLYLEFLYTTEIDGKYYHIGFDDSQHVWLVDRRQKHATSIMFHGVLGLAEAAFWKSNDEFIVVSYHYYEQPIIYYMVDVFDIAKQIQTSYQIMREEKEDFGGYYKVYLKEKGIITEDDAGYEEFLQ